MNAATLISMVVGAAVTWLVAWLYYRRAGSELRVEAAELRRLVGIILRALEAADLAKLSRDSEGRVIGVVLRGGNVSFAGSSSFSIDGSVVKRESQQTDP